MFTAKVVADCVRQYVSLHVVDLPLQEWTDWLENPAETWKSNEKDFNAALSAAIGAVDLSTHIREHPVLHLVGAFNAQGLPQTPEAWFPIPPGASTRQALAAVILLAGTCGMEVVSYGSENDGQLFVNLVTLAGKGAIAEKSKGSMRGHTDAATFPFRGTTDPDFPRIAPSPDIVFLIGLRNQESVPTVVMPLPAILEKLDSADIELLKKPSIVLSAQKTFVQGTQRILKTMHVLDGAPVLFDGPEGTWVRYTHSQSWLHDETDAAARKAKENFEAACTASAKEIVLNAGDILIVNNRKALHGRAKVGDSVGGDSRWLIRAYGLDCSQVSADQRYPQPSFKLFP